MSGYAVLIARTLRQARLSYDPRHVEGFMRMTYRTLDALGQDGFERAVLDACDAINDEGADVAEDVARSYGL